MQIIDLYTRMRDSLDLGYQGYDLFDRNEDLRFLAKAARGWEMDQASIQEWFASPEAIRQRPTAEAYLAIARDVVAKVEAAFGRELPGLLLLLPSFGEFDGFARYELGEHRVLLGIDFPDANVDYLRALTAHELSHVYRDHSPAVWAHLGKPLSRITRREYLDSSTAQEHLVSEGLATLFSQALFPEVHAAIHHYYSHEEWQWCEQFDREIHAAFQNCLSDDEDVWSFYSEDRVSSGSPSRTQYYWAAKMIAKRLGASAPNPGWIPLLVSLHELPTQDFREFFLKSSS